MTEQLNIHTIFDRLVQREDRERLLEQKAKVFWLTGLSGSGKSTLAAGLQRALHAHGKLVYVLDGLDEVLAVDPGFVRDVVRTLAGAGVLWVCAGRPAPARPADGDERLSPKLSEPWFCCAEPSADQLRHVTSPCSPQRPTNANG